MSKEKIKWIKGSELVQKTLKIIKNAIFLFIKKNQKLPQKLAGINQKFLYLILIKTQKIKEKNSVVKTAHKI